MPILSIGQTDIPYDIRVSTRARLKRIVVTPGHVEVIVPTGCEFLGAEGIEAFVHTKRRWLFDAVRDIAQRQGRLLKQHYASGAKLQYRGRWLMLDVQPGDVEAVQITCRSKFHVVVPHTLEGLDKLSAIEGAMDFWLKGRATRDLKAFTGKYTRNQDVALRGAKLSNAKHKWGSCGKDGTIRIHWRLIQAPKVAMEYVVAHELTHLIHRHHGVNFWRQLGQIMPDWARAKALLERWEGEHRAV